MEIIQLGSSRHNQNPPEINEQNRNPSLNDLKITNLKSGVKNPNRVNVFINDKFEFSLDISQVVDLKLKVGKTISKKQLDDFRKASEFGKLYQRTLEWVLMRPRSIKETRDYLYKKTNQNKLVKTEAGHTMKPVFDLSKEELADLSDQIIARLISKKYLDDLNFANYYAEYRFVKKGVSRKRLKMELTKKGIANNIIEQVVEKRNDKEEILKIIARKHKKYDKEKLIGYLCRQGFDYQLVQELVSSMDDTI